jgi:hypothetical protein
MWSAFARRPAWWVLIVATIVVLALSGVGTYALLSDDASPGAAPLGTASALEASPAGPGAALASSVGSAPIPKNSAGRTTAPSAPTKAGGSALVRWIRKFTPIGGGHGALQDVYNAFMYRDCADALAIARAPASGDYDSVEEPHRTLYEGAAAACLAVLDGRAEHWQTAIDRFPAVDLANLDCWDLEVYTVFRELVDAGRANLRVTVDSGPPNGSRCPELIRLEPDRGSRHGGYPVTVVGRNFPPTLDLFWMELGVTVTAMRVSDTLMTMVIPDASSAALLDDEITISDAPGVQGPFSAYFAFVD